MSKRKIIYILSYITLTNFISAQCNWLPMEFDDFNQAAHRACTNLAITCNSSGVPYSVLSKNGFAGIYRAEVSKFNGTAWEPVGSPSISIGTANYDNIAIDAAGTPYIAFADAGIGNRTSVYKFNGISWVAVGSISVSPGQSKDVSLALDASSTPYVAYADGTALGKLSVKKFDGTNWVYVGTPTLSIGTATCVSMVIDGSGNPMVAFCDGGNLDKITVLSFNGTTWLTVGPAGFSAANSIYVSLKLDNTGVPHVSFLDNSALGKASVMKFNGASWTYLGTPGFSSNIAKFTSLNISPTGSIYVSYIQQASPQSTVELMTFNGATWVSLGSVISAPSNIFCTSTLDGPNSIPYISYLDSYHNGMPIVRKYTGAGLTLVGHQGFANYNSNYEGSNIAIDPSGISYLCYADPTPLSGIFDIRVVKFNGTNWIPVGGVAYSGAVAYPSLCIDNFGMPYVVFRQNTQLGVVKFNGSSWTSLPFISTGTPFTTSMLIKTDQIGTPYVIYRDQGVNPNKLWAYAYVNNAWVNLGTVDNCSSASSYEHDLAFNSIGELYVSYGIGGAKVKKYNGANWLSVGNTSTLLGFPDHVHIAIGPGDEPFIFFPGGTPMVFKFNGSVWSQVGPNLSNGTIGKIAVDDTGMPIVMMSSEFSSQANVLKFNGANWSNIGDPNFSAGVSINNSMCMDDNGGIYVSYAYGYIWTKMYKSYINITSDPTNVAACPNSTVTFAASATGSITNIQWQKSSGAGYVNLTNAGMYSGVNANTLTVSAINSSINGHKFRCVYTDTCGSKHTSFAVLTCYGNTISILASSPSLCVGQSATLNVVGANSYTWNTSATTNSIVINPTITTTYSVATINSNNCVNSAGQLIAVSPLPAISVSTNDSLICVNQTTTLTATGGVSYTWASNNWGDQEVITPTITTSYTVVGSDANGCQDTAVFTQLVDPCAGIKENIYLGASFSLYPNPSHNEFYFESKIGLDADLILYNSVGQKTLQLRVVKGKNHIITNGISSGLYYCVLINDQKQIPIGKLVVE